LQILQASRAPNEGLCEIPEVVAQEGESIHRMMDELEFVNNMSTSFKSLKDSQFVISNDFYVSLV
jgi:hypothetical protein